MMKVFRYSPRSFVRALEAGVFGDRRVELLGGRVHLMTANPPHIFAVHRLVDLLPADYPRDRWSVRKEDFVRIGSWIPQPDVAVIRYPADQYLPRLPEPADIRLIVEVSDTTYPIDRGRKYRRYAAAGIPEYWIANLPDRSIQVFTQPQGMKYLAASTYGEGDTIGALAVADIFPPTN